MPLVQKALVPPKDSEAHEYDENAEGAHEDGGPIDGDFKENPKHLVHSEHEQFIHPNAMKASEYDEDSSKHLTKSQFVRERKRQFNSCKNCLKRFDDLVMRPFMIYKYENELISKKEEFLNLFMKEGDVWEKMYLNEEYNPEEVQEVRN